MTGVDGPETFAPHPARGEAVAVTWALMGTGHLLAALVAAVGLVLEHRGGGTLEPPMRAALVFDVFLGAGGAALCLRMLRATRRVLRGPLVPPDPPLPAPIPECGLVALLAVGLGVVAVLQWGATPPLLLVAAQLAFVPLGLRTDAVFRAGAGPPR